MSSHRDKLLSIFHAAVNAVSGNKVVKKEIESGEYPQQFHVIAIGKAADAMLHGIIETESENSKRILSALLITKHHHISDESRADQRIICIESDHPVPQQATIKAGEQLLAYLQKLPANEACVFLISGGASSLVEVLQTGWDLSKLQALTDYLIANAYPIDQINAVRQRISKIKGGGLWNYMGERPVDCLMISDVPGDDPAIIGSGLLFPVNDLELPDLPEKWQKEMPAFVQHKQGKDFHWKIIASLEIAKQSAANKARDLGYSVDLVQDFLQGEAEQLAKECVNQVSNNPDRLMIWGGETTVHLPEKPGKGGRNQQLALSAAIELDGLKEAYLLAAGTDGTDGVTDATGALVDSQTLQRGKENNLSAPDYLQNADAYPFFEKSGDLIKTGATGTNVMDLVLAVSVDASHQ